MSKTPRTRIVFHYSRGTVSRRSELIEVSTPPNTVQPFSSGLCQEYLLAIGPSPPLPGIELPAFRCNRIAVYLLPDHPLTSRSIFSMVLRGKLCAQVQPAGATCKQDASSFMDFPLPVNGERVEGCRMILLILENFFLSSFLPRIELGCGNVIHEVARVTISCPKNERDSTIFLPLRN